MSRKPSKAKDIILQSARKLFTEKGFRETAVHEITDDARVNKALLFYYFKSKENLYYALISDIMKAITDAVKAELKKEKTVDKKLKNIFKIFIENYLEQGEIFKILYTEISAPGACSYDVLSKFEEDIIRLAGEVIREGIKAGLFQSVDPRLAAIALIGAPSIFIKQNIISGSTVPYDEIEAHTVDIFLKGLAKPKK
ncbi:MAG: TetR/AcrR family transcriptional regulator [bacterium]